MQNLYFSSWEDKKNRYKKSIIILYLFTFAHTILIKMKLIRILSITATVLLLACCDKMPTRYIDGYNKPVTGADISKATQQLSILIEDGRKAVDSIKSPVIGTTSAALTMKPDRFGQFNVRTTSLMNFAADALLHEAQLHSKEKIDVAISNKGGLRSEIAQGVITFGDIYNVFPFENTLVVMTLKGNQMIHLFNDIAKKNGEAISGAELGIYPPAQDIAFITIGGRKVESEREYRIATSDYLAQGNDGLVTLAQGYNRREFGITIRDLMLKYVSDLHKQGKSVEPVIDDRIRDCIVTVE